MGRYRDNTAISFGGFYDTGRKLLVSGGAFNGLLELDKETFAAKYLQAFPCESRTKYGLHHKIYHCRGMLFFAPDNADGIHVYDLKSSMLSMIPIKFEKKGKKRCIDSQRIGDKLWLFYAFAENPFVIFDLVTFEISYFYGVAKSLPDEIQRREKAVFYSPFARDDDEVFGVIWDSCYILRLNLISQDVQVVSVKECAKRLSGVAYLNDELYITQLCSRSVASVNWKNREVNSYSPPISSEFESAKELVYSSVIAVDEVIFLIPDTGKKIFCLDPNKKTILPFASLPDGFEDFTDQRKNWRRFYNFDVLEKGFRLYPTGCNMMLTVRTDSDPVTGEVFRMSCLWEKMQYQELIVNPHLREVTGPVLESVHTGLDHFTDYVAGLERRSTGRKNHFGQDIWRNLKNGE